MDFKNPLNISDFKCFSDLKYGVQKKIDIKF